VGGWWRGVEVKEEVIFVGGGFGGGVCGAVVCSCFAGRGREMFWMSPWCLVRHHVGS